jgi:hypothetical protein
MLCHLCLCGKQVPVTHSKQHDELPTSLLSCRA